jgi:pimeloyl-ACP methyl ester carboxylesterase
MNIYLISGLGADSRAFKQLTFRNGTKLHHLEWIKPFAHETMNEYAKRLAQKIDTRVPYAIIGLSFGGMLASEMCTFLQPHRVILLSSVNNHKELPFYYRWPSRLGIHKLLPSRPGKRSSFLLNWLFGLHEKKDVALLDDVLKNTDPVFSRWAIHALLTWNRMDTDNGVIRIHGDRDRVLPVTTFTPHYVVRNGGHLIVMTHAREVSELIDRALFEK